MAGTFHLYPTRISQGWEQGFSLKLFITKLASSGKGENPNHQILCRVSLKEARERQGPGERVKEQVFSFWKHRPLCPTPKIRACCIQRSPAAAAAAKSLQLCLTLCNPIDGSPPGSPVPGILQASSALTTAYGWDFYHSSLILQKRTTLACLSWWPRNNGTSCKYFREVVAGAREGDRN